MTINLSQVLQELSLKELEQTKDLIDCLIRKKLNVDEI